MKNTTLCYIFRGEECLLLHRNKKEEDPSAGKWIGVGGKLEEGESPEDGVLRETLEETGLTLTDYRYRGVVTFVSDQWEGEYMHLFTATGFEGEVSHCEEGTLVWRPFQDLFHLPCWAGDIIFLKELLVNPQFFSLKLEYQGEKLLGASLNGKKLLDIGD